MRRPLALPLLAGGVLIVPALLAQAPPRAAARTAVTLPEGLGKDTTQKVCGSACHGPDVVAGTGRTRDQWTAVVNSMVARGAKATETELAQIIAYLSGHFGPGYTPPVTRGGSSQSATRSESAAGRGPGPLGSGAADSHLVNAAGAERGKSLFGSGCGSCHGLKARGGNEALPAHQRGPDLIRSLVVLRDRYGSEIGSFLAKGHPMRTGGNARSLTKQQVGDLADFLHQRVYATLRNGPELTIQNILSGDPKAGQVYFSGAGRCSTCHSAGGDFAGIGARYDPPTLQQKFLFPRTVAFGRGRRRASEGKPVRVTVTPASGEKVEGTLVSLDDFNVALRDSEGNYRSFAITPQVKVVKDDPLEYHVALLDQISDRNIHDVVAYLESLK